MIKLLTLYLAMNLLSIKIVKPTGLLSLANPYFNAILKYSSLLTGDSVDFQSFRFIVVAGILYAAFHFAYNQIPDDYLRNTIYPNVIGHAAAKTIKTLTPDRTVVVSNNALISPRAKMNIVRGCDGSGVWFMLSAAIIGFGASFRQTITGLVAGTITVYIINQIRIVGLYYVIEHNRAWFPPVHTYYAPTLIIILVAGFFYYGLAGLWISRQNRLL